MRLSTSDIGAAQLLSVTEIAPKSPFLCVNKSPIWYNGLRACPKAIRCNVDTALRSLVSKMLERIVCII